MSINIDRTYKVHFSGQPTIKDIKEELTYAERVFSEWTAIHIAVVDFADIGLIEVDFTFESSR